jgi:two-component system sensor kinase FixL
MKSISVQLGAAENQSRVRHARDWNVPFDSPTVVTGLVVFVGYYLGAKLGFALTFQPHPVSVLWPPNSILAAALLLTPLRMWWLVLLAAFPAHWAAQLQNHIPPTMILCWFISNSCEALIGAGLLRYLIGGPLRFGSLRNAGMFCLCVVIAGPFFSSFLDSAFVRWNHWGQGGYWELFRIRFTSNILAALTVTPLIVTWATSGMGALRKARLWRCLEAGVLFLGLLSVIFIVLYKIGPDGDSALLYLPLPFLLWAAVRFGSCGASTAVATVALLTIWSAAHGHGPFSGGSAEQSALSVQMFLIVMSVPLMFLAAVIEELAKGETGLRESEQRFRVVADSAPVLIWMSGLDKLCTFFNRPWLEFTGRTMEQEMGNGWAEGVHPDDLQRCLKVYTEAFDARKGFVMQYRLRRNDGEYRWVSDQGVARHDAQGNFVGYVGSCVDVTELINKDEALRESEERMRLAADAVNLGIWEWDLSKDEAWVTDTRRAFVGWPASGKITLEHFISRVHPDDRNRIRQAIDDAIHKGKDYDSEYRMILSDGSVRWMSTRASVRFDANAKPARLLGISIDITARKQAELEALQRRQEVGHLSRVAVMGEMAASIAHELNQPLSGITSNASAGQRFIDRGDVDLGELRDLLTDIVADGRRAGDVIRGIQSMVKKGAPARQRVNLNDLVMNVVRMVNPDAVLHSCEMETLLDPNLPPIEADPIQLQQVLINLVINAFDAMRNTSLSRRKVVIATEWNGESAICTSVRDYGVGISEEARDRLFERFFTTKAEGLGMGLGIVRSIVESHGGTVAAENVEGGGARLHFTLPASAAAL